jgi:hypothetical protein
LADRNSISRGDIDDIAGYKEGLKCHENIEEPVEWISERIPTPSRIFPLKFELPASEEPFPSTTRRVVDTSITWRPRCHLWETNGV